MPYDHHQQPPQWTDWTASTQQLSVQPPPMHVARIVYVFQSTLLLSVVLAIACMIANALTRVYSSMHTLREPLYTQDATNATINMRTADAEPAADDTEEDTEEDTEDSSACPSKKEDDDEPPPYNCT